MENINLENLNFKKITYDSAWDIADGIEFVEIFTNRFICGFTKEDFKNAKAIPKSNRRYYILRNGEKVYFQEGNVVAKNKDGFLIFVK